MANLASHRVRAMEELERGREFANQLRQLFSKSTGEDDEDDVVVSKTPSAEDLVAKVVGSFTNTLFLLTTTHPSQQQQLHNVSDSSCWVPSKSEDSQDSCKSRSSRFPIPKDRRGSYKRRKNSHTWEQDSETCPTEDGHAWRKYGQKMILHAKYPRNYFRCTHKFDQGCQATKQVQRIQEEPPLYRTTYYGHHTCRNLLNPQIILDSPDLPDSSYFLSFDNNTLSAHPNPPFLSSSFPDSIKKEEEQCDNIMQDHNNNCNVPSSSSNDYLLSPNELPLESDHRNVGLFYDPDHHELDTVMFDDFEFSSPL